MTDTKTLYVNRPVLNAADIIAWAKEQGFATTLLPDDMHVTVAYSKEPFDWSGLTPDTLEIVASAGDRDIKAFGDGTVIVLAFENDALSSRWASFRDAGASWSWPEYRPHVTLTYKPGDADLANMTPYAGPIHLGPEHFQEIDENWSAGVAEKFAKENPMDALKLFIPITKVDAAKRLVYGVATAEQKDRAGEICDYASTKPFYEKWSGEVSKASDGKSLGNVRAMHGKIAAGKVTEISFNDEAKQIEICAKVVDDAEWAKVEEGVYTGFSQGGAYVKRWKDADGLQRYTADPAEVSLVDMPCLPSATFQVIKADGATEDRHFVSVEFGASISNEAVAAKAHDLAKAAGDEAKWPDHIEAARSELTKAASGETVDPAKAEADNPTVDILNEVEQVWKSKDGKTFKKKEDAVKHAADLVKIATPADEAIAALCSALGKADPSAVKEEANTGAAMPDGSLPIETKADLEAAVKAYGEVKNKATTKRHLAKRAKALKATDLLPADWVLVEKVKDADGVEKSVSLYSISNLVQLLAAIDDAEESFEMDSYWGGSVNATEDLKTRFGAVLVEFGDIVAEALDAILGNMSEEESTEAVNRSATVIGLMKAGARHSKGDMALVQKAHDATVALGAKCAQEEANGTAKHAHGDLTKGTDLEKVLAENADMKATFEKMLPLMTEAAGKITALEAEVKLIKEQPMPGGPVRLNVIGKEDEVTSNIRKAAEAGDGEAVALELFKLSHGRPLTGLPGILTPTAPTVQSAPAEAAK